MLSYFEAQGFGNSQTGPCQQTIEHAIKLLGGGQDSFYFGRLKRRCLLRFLIDRWQANVIQVPLTREKLLALAILCSGEYCCRDQVVVDNGLWRETPFAVLSRFCFHRGDQFFHLRVVECGERTFPNFLVEIDNCSRVRVQSRNSNSLAALVL